MIHLIYSNECPACVQTKPIYTKLMDEFPKIHMTMEEISPEVTLKYSKFLPQEPKVNDKGEVIGVHTPFPIPLVLFLKDGEYIGHLVGIQEEQIKFIIKEVYEQGN